MKKDIVVIGASAGGIDALRAIVACLPANFPAPIFVVVHTSPDSPGVLDLILSRAGKLRALAGKDNEPIEDGRIYVAPPDHHLVLEPGTICLTRGPKENRFRPAIDPLFRSAAQVYGPRVVGVILTGGLDDGTAGLWAVKQLGGTAIVQDPAEALVDSMPRSAIKNVKVDYVVSLNEIPALLERLVSTPVEKEGRYAVPEDLNIEVDIAKEKPPVNSGIFKLGGPSTFACPECHGVLLQLKDGDRTRFRCHTGHAYSVDNLLADLKESIGDSLWNAVRAIEEEVMLLNHMASHGGNHGETADIYRKKARQSQQRAEVVRQAALAHEEVIEKPADELVDRSAAP